MLGVMTDPAPVTVPDAPEVAREVFGDRLALAEAFAAELADTGVSHGLIGPREVPILWERHVLNCAVPAVVIPEGSRIVDVGSGAGLPGIAMAIARPDLDVVLVEPMLRRTTWLSETIARLGLERVEVVRGRAEDVAGSVSAPIVTARAVARIDKLARWCVPLLDRPGRIVALKGRSAREELAEETAVLRRLGMTAGGVHEVGDGILEETTLVMDLRFG